MDQDRNLRSLIPPLVFVASLVWVRLLQSGWEGFQSDKVGATMAALLAGGAAVVVALGFVLSSVSILLLRAWSHQRFGKTIDIAGFPDDLIVSFGAEVGLSRDLALMYPLQCAALYDHQVVREKRKGVHEWAARRWNMFHVSVHCCLALALAHGAWLIYYVARGSIWTPSWTLALGWWLPDAVLFVCMGVNACVAFHENRDLFKVLLEVSESSNVATVDALEAAEHGAAPVGAAGRSA